MAALGPERQQECQVGPGGAWCFLSVPAVRHVWGRGHIWKAVLHSPVIVPGKGKPSFSQGCPPCPGCTPSLPPLPHAQLRTPTSALIWVGYVSRLGSLFGDRAPSE